MATASPILPTASPIAPSTTSASGSANTLTSNDFINLLVTQLQNQDPTQPMSNSELLQQVTEIGQLQSQTSLQTSLQGLTLQNQIGSGSSLIGKHVAGTDANNNAASGIVTSVSIANNNVNLQLDSGQALPIANVTQITAVNPVTTTPSTTTTTTSTTPA